MSSTAAVEDVHEAQDHAPDHDAHHPSDGHYVRIAIALALITGLEVAWTYIDALPKWAVVGGLLLMMAIKFVTVASQFMHLKFDSKVLSRLFYAGLILATSVYVAALFTFELFTT